MGPRVHSSPLFTELKIMKLDQIFKLRLMQFIYDSLNGFSPIKFNLWFKKSTDLHTYSTRSASRLINPNLLTDTENLHLPQIRTSYGYNSIKYLGPKIWNSIPYNIRKITSRSLFTIVMKRLILSL